MPPSPSSPASLSPAAVTEGRPPVIVLGMHRSGTSMLTRMLERLGLFMGGEGENDEAALFLALNRWLMREAGGDWDHPAPARALLEDAAARGVAAAFLRGYLHTPRMVSFLGWRGWLRHRVPWKAGHAWGWKDPRNTFTLPVWLEVFPQARVIHITRNGVDVANSLKVREARSYAPDRQAARLAFPGGVRGVWPRLGRGRFAGSPRCRTLEGGFSLWEEYMAEARRQVEARGEAAVEVRYEDFLADPPDHLSRLAAFAGLGASEEEVRAVAAEAKPSRREAFRADPELAAFAEQVSARLAAFGY